ncbi:hypothetical protein [Pseudomonas sp. EL_65y_Pfl2_R96]|uniref:hypothetical protein n=1 Tax=Pseudomonas sp. EL_65y_Pfl2_R96 TaxID=3088699 RepID=UPI0030DA54F5
MDGKKTGILSIVKQTIIDSKDYVAEGVDLLIKTIDETGALSEIPVVSQGMKVLEIKDSFQQHKYRRNCAAFLEACKINDTETVENLYNKLNNTGKTEEFTDSLLLITIESSKPLKAAIVGRLVSKLCTRDIDYTSYETLVQIIHAASVASLLALPEFIKSNDGFPYKHSNKIPEEALLFACGLAYRDGSKFNITELGVLFYNCAFKDYQDF